MPQRNLNPKWDLGAMSYRELLAARSRLERSIKKASPDIREKREQLLARIEASLKARRDRKFGVTR